MAVQNYLLAQIAHTLNGTISTDPAVLAQNAAGFTALFGLEAQVQLYLLCQIATSSGA